MFKNDFLRAAQHARALPFYTGLTDARKGVLIEMMFQMGPTTVRKFKRFFDAIQEGNWGRAKFEMLDSIWYKQTPERCEQLAEIFYEG